VAGCTSDRDEGGFAFAAAARCYCVRVPVARRPTQLWRSLCVCVT
jgi:hypothetical protein